MRFLPFAPSAAITPLSGQERRQEYCRALVQEHTSRGQQNTMALIGLARVTNDAGDVRRQYDVLDPICTRVFEETASRRRLVQNRPQLLAALDHLRPGDLLVVKKAKHLASSTIDGLDVLNDLVERGVTIRVLEGIAAGEHAGRSPILALGRDIAETHRQLLSQKIKIGLQAARGRGNVGGRPTVLDDDKRVDILSRRAQGEALRAIAHSTGVSVGTVHNFLTQEVRRRQASSVFDDGT
jgi:DNA invertase Pin-like site-specific DNA recombinase